MKNKIEVRHTSILINNYKLGDNIQLENMLSVYDKKYHRMKPIAYMYDEKSSTLYIPRGIRLSMLENMFNEQATIIYEANPSDKVIIHTKTPPKDDMQRKAISFIVGEGNDSYTKKYPQLLIQLPTGSGKTYIISASLEFLGTKAFIILPTDKLKLQMIKSLCEFTDIGKGYIKNIKSVDDIEKIINDPYPKWKVYVACHSALITAANKNGWYILEKLFKHTGIGVKIYDEAHLYFENMLNIDFHTNTKKTIYVTATFKRSDYSENLVFMRSFNNVISYGDNLSNNYRKHVVYLGVKYNSKPSISEQCHLITNMGFNKIRYSEYQSEQDEFYDTINFLIKYFRSYEGKIMILSTTIDSVCKIKKFIEDNFSDLSVSEYHSKVNKNEKEKAFKSDIICTTPKSAGTGVDINGLRTVIMCEAYSSEVEAEQVSGRLREYSENDDTFYVELIDYGFDKVVKMWKNRLRVFKKKCKKLGMIDLSKK